MDPFATDLGLPELASKASSEKMTAPTAVNQRTATTQSMKKVALYAMSRAEVSEITPLRLDASDSQSKDFE